MTPLSATVSGPSVVLMLFQGLTVHIEVTLSIAESRTMAR
jgi:hypothetical protein